MMVANERQQLHEQDRALVEDGAGRPPGVERLERPFDGELAAERGCAGDNKFLRTASSLSA
jgi:hypothetical protein